MMHIAFYRGPPKIALHKFTHWLICLVTRSQYSHCELVIDGMCYTSSVNDGGVRAKYLNLESGHWDVLDVSGDKAAAKAWFDARMGKAYDWVGVMRFLIPFMSKNADQWFCSEAVAESLGIPDAYTYTPEMLYQHFNKGLQWQHHTKHR